MTPTPRPRRCSASTGWRGRGVGSALLTAVLAWSLEQGVHKLTLQMWPLNTAARDLYQKFGFVPEGRLRRHYRRVAGQSQVAAKPEHRDRHFRSYGALRGVGCRSPHDSAPN